MKTKTIEVTISMGLSGCKRTTTFEVEADMTEDEIEETALDAVHSLITWSWQEVEDRPKAKRK